MKLAAFLLAIAFHVSATGISQITLSEKNAPLEKIFSAIEKQSGYVFFYDYEWLDKATTVSIKVKNASLDEVLNKCLKDQPLTYNIIGKTIVMKQKEEIEAEILAPELPPPSIITGTITDEKGQPLAGATILIKGTPTGTKSDAKGNFSINAEPNSTLIISYVGFEFAEVNVGNRTNISVLLKPSLTTGDEVVVVGYGTEKKINLTGAVSSVNSKVLESRPITSIGQGLQGAVPNLNITPGSGTPGKAATFNVRGNTSINGGSPLILVDGVPMDINLLNPNDIENVTVLKDASSAAIYGARAAYGVILVSTKTGKKRGGKPKISLSSFVSSNEPTVKIHFIDTKERIAFMNEAYQRVNGANYYTDLVMNAMLAHYNDPSQPEAIITPQAPTVWTGVANTDWEKILMSNSYPMQQYTASISGGTDKLEYYTSFSYLHQKGLTNKKLFDEHFNRYNFMTNLSYHVLDWLTVSTRTSINNSDKRFPPNYPWFRNEFPEDGTIFQANVYSTQPYKDPNGNWTHEGSIENPAQMLSEGGYQTRGINDVWMTGAIKLTPVKNMTFNFDYSSNTKNTKELNYVSLQPFYDKDGNVIGYYGGSNPNRVIRTNYQDKYHVLNAYADYANTFSNKHYVKVLAGFNQEDAQYNWNQAERRDLIINTIPYLNLASGASYTYDGINEYAIRGAFTRVNYIFDNRYLFEFNGRYDGSSKFPKDHRFSFFPSASIGWRVDNEKFFEGIKNTVNELKFRASYGSLGNQNVTGYYPYVATLSAAQVNYIIGGQLPMSVYAPGLVSASLTWETVIQKNLGVDFSLFNYRLYGSLDIYKRDTKNMLTKSQTLPAVLAVGEPQTNAADLSTHGFDLNLGWRDKIGKNIRYEVTAILSDYSAKITKYSNPVGLISDYYVGSKLGGIWGLTTGGLFQTDEEAKALDQSNINGRVRQAGDLWMVDLNKDGKITRGLQTLADHGDMSVIGNNTPRYSFGFRTSVGWKGFDIDIFLQGVAKRDVWLNSTYFLSQYTNEWGGIAKVSMDYWSPENPDAYYPRPIISGAGDIVAVQSRFLQNAAYIRLKQLNLSYTLPSGLTTKYGIERLKVFFSGSNLWTGTKMVKISDPELAGPSSYPLYKSLSLGVNLDF